MQLRIFALAGALCLLAAGAADARVVHFMAMLKGADEVPPNATTGTGVVDAALDTDAKTFHYAASYSGLTGPAVAAHFHGPAMAGMNAPPMVPMTTLVSPITGTVPLSDGQITDLLAGKWYFNVHTAAHPGGEIRGQLIEK